MYSASESLIAHTDNIFQLINCQSSPHIKIKNNVKYEAKVAKIPENSNKLQKSRKSRRSKKKFISKVLQILNKACRSTQYPSIPNLTVNNQRKSPVLKQKSRNTTKHDKVADISTNTDKIPKNTNKNKEVIVLHNKHNKNVEKSNNDAKYLKVIKKNKELLVLRDYNANNEKVELINELHRCIEEGLLRNKQKYIKQERIEEKNVNFDVEKKPSSETFKNKIMNNNSNKNTVKRDEKSSIKLENKIFRKQSELSIKTTLLHDVIVTNPSPKYAYRNAEPKHERVTKKTIRREKERNIIINILSDCINDVSPPRNMYETLKLIASRRRKLLNTDHGDQSTKKQIEYLEKHYFL